MMAGNAMKFRRWVGAFLTRRTLWFSLVALVLFLLPFFWFPRNLYLLGDDDTGLMYLNPVGALRQFSSVWYSADSVPNAGPLVGPEFVFSITLFVLRIVTLGVINIQQLALGILLATSFFYTVRLISYMTNTRSPAHLIAGLVYVLSSYFVLTEYYFLLPSTYVIVIAPLFTYCLMRAIRERSVRPLLVAAIWGLILSRTLFTPVFINFMFVLALFAVLYGYVTGGVRLLIRSIGAYSAMVVLLVLINAVLFVPVVHFMFVDTMSNTIATDLQNRGDNIDGTVKDLAFSDFQKQKVSDVLMNTFPEDISQQQGFVNHYFYKKFYNNRQYLMLVILGLSFSGFLFFSRRERLVVIPVLVTFIITLLFLTADAVPLFKQLFLLLVNNVPVFSMNRYPSLKFHIPYVLLYSVIVGIGLQSLLVRVSKKIGYPLFALCVVCVIAVAFPLLTGKVYYDPNDRNHNFRVLTLNESYNQMVRELPKIADEDTSFLLFPLGYGYGSFLQGSGDQQVYRSTITGFKNATGRDLFGNLMVINTPLDHSVAERARRYYFEHDVASLWSLAVQLNIKYIIYTKNTDWLERYSEVLPQHTYDQAKYYAPVNTTKPVYENTGYVVYAMKNADHISRFSVGQESSHVTFNKDADYLYRLKVTTNGPDAVVMHSGFSKQWRLVRITKEEFSCLPVVDRVGSRGAVAECKNSSNNIRALTSAWRLSGKQEEKTDYRQVDGYANAWTIDTEGKDQYFALVFRGQYVYMIGGAISLVVLVLYVILLSVKRGNGRKEIVEDVHLPSARQ